MAVSATIEAIGFSYKAQYTTPTQFSQTLNLSGGDYVIIMFDNDKRGYPYELSGNVLPALYRCANETDSIPRCSFLLAQNIAAGNHNLTLGNSASYYIKVGWAVVKVEGASFASLPDKGEFVSGYNFPELSSQIDVPTDGLALGIATTSNIATIAENATEIGNVDFGQDGSGTTNQNFFAYTYPSGYSATPRLVTTDSSTGGYHAGGIISLSATTISTPTYPAQYLGNPALYDQIDIGATPWLDRFV